MQMIQRECDKNAQAEASAGVHELHRRNLIDPNRVGAETLPYLSCLIATTIWKRSSRERSKGHSFDESHFRSSAKKLSAHAERVGNGGNWKFRRRHL